MSTHRNTHTEIWDTNTHQRAIIECPVKTMNIDENTGIYQVDTGIVLFPDLSKRYEQQIEAFSLAYVAFNAPHFADFVIERPTAILKNGMEVTQVYHYSEIRSLEAKNTVFCIGESFDRHSISVNLWIYPLVGGVYTPEFSYGISEIQNNDECAFGIHPNQRQQ